MFGRKERAELLTSFLSFGGGRSKGRRGGREMKGGSCYLLQYFKRMIFNKGYGGKAG